MAAFRCLVPPSAVSGACLPLGVHVATCSSRQQIQPQSILEVIISLILILPSHLRPSLRPLPSAAYSLGPSTPLSFWLHKSLPTSAAPFGPKLPHASQPCADSRHIQSEEGTASWTDRHLLVRSSFVLDGTLFRLELVFFDVTHTQPRSDRRLPWRSTSRSTDSPLASRSYTSGFPSIARHRVSAPCQIGPTTESNRWLCAAMLVE